MGGLVTQAEARLAIFAPLLTEEWPVSVGAAYLQARLALARPAYQLACIEYPPEGIRPALWVCLTKAAAAADVALGIRAEPVRAAFVDHLRESCVPVSVKPPPPALRLWLPAACMCCCRSLLCFVGSQAAPCG